MIAGEIASALDIAFGNAPLNADEIAGLLELPPDSAMGDYAFSVLQAGAVAAQGAADDRGRAGQGH